MNGVFFRGRGCVTVFNIPYTSAGEFSLKKVSENLTIPLLVGGGIRTQHQLENAFKNGADVVVIGTAFEENNEILDTIIS